MAQIISATRTRSYGRAGGKRARFLFQARELLDAARGYAAEGRFDQALEVAYQSALRTAGARVAASEEKRWAESFKGYSRTRARVASGLDEVPGGDFVYGLMQRAAQFLDESELETSFGSFAA